MSLVAVAALAGMVVCVLAIGPSGRSACPNATGAHSHSSVSVVALWTLALWASPVAVAAVPAIYPLVFATLPLGAALGGDDGRST